MLRCLRRLLLCSCALLPACMTSEVADLRPLLAQQSFPVTQDDVPSGCESIGLVAVEDSGFYLFGIVPIVPMQFDGCVARLVERAQKLGADGVAHVVVDYRPSSFLRFAGLFLPDWFGYIGLTGCAWRRGKHAN